MRSPSLTWTYFKLDTVGLVIMLAPAVQLLACWTDNEALFTISSQPKQRLSARSKQSRIVWREKFAIWNPRTKSNKFMAIPLTTGSINRSRKAGVRVFCLAWKTGQHTVISGCEWSKFNPTNLDFSQFVTFSGVNYTVGPKKCVILSSSVTINGVTLTGAIKHCL